MKIAIICPNYPPAIREGGIAHYTQKLSQELVSQGEKVVIITGDGYCGCGVDGAISILNFKGKWERKTVKNIVDQLNALRVDIVNLQYSPIMYPHGFKIFWPYYSKKLISTVSFHTLWGGSKINHLAALCLLGSAQGILATNSEIICLLKRYLPIFLKKSYFVQIGANILPSQNKTDNKRLFEKYSLISDVPVISYFGMAYPGKGMQLLLQTAQILKMRHQLDFKLLIIGGGESDVAEYVQDKRELAHALGIQDNVIFTGKIPALEVSTLLNSSFAIILPFTSGASDRRGSLMVALAHHKAVITTKPAIPIAAFKNGENMIWPDHTSAENLAERVKYVLQDTAFRKKLENGARALAWNYRWEDIAEKTRQYFQTVISNKRSSRSASTGRKG